MDGDAGRACKAPRSSSASPSNPAIAEERGVKDDDKNNLHKCLKTALLSVVIVIVVLVLLLPTIVFFLPLPMPVCCYSTHYIICPAFFGHAGEPKSRVVRLRLVAS